jgi:hypothetical protein
LDQETKLTRRDVTMFSGPAMAHQLVLAEVGMVAAGHGTLVGLYPCVSPHVVISVTDHGEPHGAKSGLVWFLVGMHSSDMNLYQA